MVKELFDFETRGGEVNDVIETARREVEQENFRQLVEQKKIQLRWPWWKKLFPYKIKIQVIDLRKEK